MPRGATSLKSPNRIALPSTRCAFMQRLSWALKERCLVEERSRMVVGVSGGADSFALLAGLAALSRRKDLRYDLHVVYVHHHLRKEADVEAVEVMARAQRLNLSSEVATIHPASLPGNLSANARKLRYQALAEAAGRFRTNVIATAHHGDDLMETILMRLARGAGGSGLRAIAPMQWRSRMKGVTLIRPLLNQSHENCVDLLRSIRWDWFEDAGNRDERRNRNALRARLAEALTVDERRRMAHRLWHTMDAAAEGDRLIRRKARARLDRAFDPSHHACLRKEMAGLSSVVICEMLRLALQKAGAEAGIRHAPLEMATRIILSDATEPCIIEVGRGFDISITATHVEVMRSTSMNQKKRRE